MIQDTEAKMRILLVNKTNYDQDWAAESLIDVIRPDMHALILPLAYDQGYSSDADIYRERFSQGSAYRYDLERPLRSYGIPQENISFLDYYKDSGNVMRDKIRKSEIVCLVGNDPMECMQRIEDLDLESTLKNYDGVLIAVSAAAKILQDLYYDTLDEDKYFHYEQGLGILSGVDLDIHYMEDKFHLEGIIHSLQERAVPQIIMPEIGGALIDRGNINLLGNAFLADGKDLDEVYSLYEEVKED